VLHLRQSWNIQPVYKVNNKAADSPDTMYQLGRYYQGQRRYEQAAEAYRKALDADGSFVEAHNGLGVIYSMQGRYDEAVTEFRAAISQAPNAGHLYNNLGHALYLQGAYAEAVSALKQAATLDPDNPRTLNNLALAYAKAGEADKSRQVFAEAAKPASADSTVVAPAASNQASASQPAPVEPISGANPASSNSTVIAHASSNQAGVSQPAPVEPISSAKPASADAAVVAHVASDQVSVSQPVPVEPGPGTKPASADSTVVTHAASDKISVSQPAPVEPSSGTKQAVAQPTVQTLALPKDRGVIRSAAAVLVTTTENHVETGPIASNVYAPSERAEPVRGAAIIAPTEVMATKAAPEAATIAPAPVTQADSSTMRLHLEVSNGNGVTGMARKIAYFLHDSGYAKARLTNRKPFTVQTTQIQYRYGHQKDAEHLQSSLPGYTGIALSSNLRADINLRVVLGRDMMQHTAYFNDNSQKLRFARND
jgi:thioredoxin-like negative regulator of GroEL